MNKYKHFFSKLVNMFSDCMLSLINSCCEHAKAYIYKFQMEKVKSGINPATNLKYDNCMYIMIETYVVCFLIKNRAAKM